MKGLDEQVERLLKNQLQGFEELGKTLNLLLHSLSEDLKRREDLNQADLENWKKVLITIGKLLAGMISSLESLC